MAFNKIAVANRFVHAKHDDYGTRKGPVKSLVYHMAEGWNVWRYLSTGNVARGVSVHFTIEKNGEIVQMLNLSRISGSINPRTLRTDNDTYYGYKHAKGVLGSWWSNPNNAVLSVEIAGKAVDGPNQKQIQSAIRLFDYLRRKYPNIKPLGHRDFQNVKRCPGTTPAMKAIFSGCGGHGMDYRKPDPKPKPEPTPAPVSGGDTMIISQGMSRTSNMELTMPKGTKVYEKPGDSKPLFTTDAQAKVDYFGYTRDPKDWWAVEMRPPASVFPDGKARASIVYVKEDPSFELKRRVAPPDPSAAEIDRLQKRLASAQKAVRDLAVAVDNASELAAKAESVVGKPS